MKGIVDLEADGRRVTQAGVEYDEFAVFELAPEWVSLAAGAGEDLISKASDNTDNGCVDLLCGGNIPCVNPVCGSINTSCPKNNPCTLRWC